MNKETLPFGNRISGASIIPAKLIKKMCCLVAKGNNTPIAPVAIAYGQAYKDFGMLTIVDKSKANAQEAMPIDTQKAIIIGTIRMGFGHWRMAIAMASAAHNLGYTPYLLDLMSFDGTTSQKTIKLLEYWYNVGSRFSQQFKWFNVLFWERITSKGERSLKSCVEQKILSSLFTPLLQNMPKDIPVLSMHPWIGHTAVMCGVKNVVSIIPDNYAMAFWLVEGSRHTVQSPSAYMGYRTMLSMDEKYEITNCLPADSIIEAGHYVDYEIVSAIEQDCNKRLERLQQGKPRRFLLTMGGAGAQAYRFADIIKTCKTQVEQNKACFFVNMGDHAGRWNILEKILKQEGIKYYLHTEWENTKKIVEQATNQDIYGIHVFLHKDFYVAVYLTNLLLHVSDIMITKPSELSFYPIPKLFIQRVGKHEAWGAIRGSEMGDGTIETANNKDLHRTLKTLIESTDLLKLYIKHIKLNYKAGIYNGAYNAIKYLTKE